MSYKPYVVQIKISGQLCRANESRIVYKMRDRAKCVQQKSSSRRYIKCLEGFGLLAKGRRAARLLEAPVCDAKHNRAIRHTKGAVGPSTEELRVTKDKLFVYEKTLELPVEAAKRGHIRRTGRR